MTLDELKTEWEKDSVIDDSDLGRSSISASKLHSKYLNELVNYKLRLVKVNDEMSALYALKGRYFRGELTTAELREHGWEQWHFKTLKSDIPDLIEADDQYRKMVTKEQYIKTTIFFLESVMKEIGQRSFHNRVAMDWIKFRAGG